MIPTPSPARFGLPDPRPHWTVLRDGTAIGQIRQEGTPPAVDYWWRTFGNPFFAPTSTGAWWTAVLAVERYADRPSGYRGDPMPAVLRIARVEDGAVVRPADGVRE